MPTSAYINGYEPQQFTDFSGGLNVRDKADAVDPREAIDLLNVTFNEHGAILQRDGFTDFTVVDLAERCDSMAAYYTASGSRQLILGCGTRLVACGGLGGVVGTVLTGQVRGPYSFARFGAPGSELMYAANGADTLRRWNGATWAAPAGIYNGSAGALPKAGSITVTATVPGQTSGSNASNRLIATAFGTQTAGGPGGFATNPSRWFASNPGDPEKWETDGSPGTAANSYTDARGRNYGDLTPGDGEQIMAAVTWRELVFIFKETKFFVLWGESVGADGTPVFNFREIVNSVGLAASQAVAVGRDGVYFFNRRGIYRTTGGDPVLLSDKLDPLWTGNPAPYYGGYPINLNALAAVRMAWHMGQLFVAIPTGVSTFNDRMLVYDTDHDWWTVYDIAASALAGFRRIDRNELHHGYSTGPLRVGRRAYGSTDDNGLPISSRWRSGWLDFGSSQQKVIRETKIWGTGAIKVGFSVDFFPPQVAEVPISFSPVPPPEVTVVNYGWANTTYATYQALSDDNSSYRVLATRTS